MTDHELDYLKQSFVSIVSHELRTPVAVVKGYLSLMEKLIARGASSQSLKQFLIEAQNGLERLHGIITELINYCEVEQGTPLEVMREFEVVALWKHIAPLINTLAQEKDIQLDVSTEPDLAKFKGNEQRLREALFFLLDNAIKFTDNGGKVTVRFWNEQSQLKIMVEDTGVGIPAEEIPRIFDSFYQVEPYLTRSKGGLGLGLSIAKHIIEDHGGNIEVESIKGEGSKFIVALPYNYQDAREKLEKLSHELDLVGEQSLVYASELSDLYEEKKMTELKLEEMYKQMELYAKDLSSLYKKQKQYGSRDTTTSN